jgi:hypothetical protein
VTKREYNLKRATIHLEEKRKGEELLVIRAMRYTEYAKNLVKLQEMRIAGQHESLEFTSIQHRVRETRRAMQRVKSRFYRVKIELKGARFNNFSLTFDLAVGTPDEETLAKQLRQRLHETIRYFRQDRRALEPQPATFGAHFIEMVTMDRGRYFLKPGQILRLHVKKNFKELFADKRPVNMDKHIGIELEFCAPITEEMLAIKLRRAGMQSYVQLKKDGSLRPQENEGGFELAVLLPEKGYKLKLAALLNLVKEIGAVVKNRRCGLHIHLDMRQRNKDRVYRNLVSCQDVLMQLVDPSRRNNEFCQRVSSRKMPIRFKGDRRERYKTVNAAAYYKYRTLEVRMHEGSVDYGQITGWVDLLIKIANHRKSLLRSVSTLTLLKKRFNLDSKTYQYAIERSCYWQLNENSDRPDRNLAASRRVEVPFVNLNYSHVAEQGVQANV